jgi:hypothetical protein
MTPTGLTVQASGHAMRSHAVELRRVVITRCTADILPQRLSGYHDEMPPRGSVHPWVRMGRREEECAASWATRSPRPALVRDASRVRTP